MFLRNEEYNDRDKINLRQIRLRYKNNNETNK